MTIWYGFRSVINRSKINYKGTLVRPNGSNLYIINENDLSKLPPSHVPINLELEYIDLLDIPTLSEILKNKLNEYLTAPGSVVKIVDDVRTEIINNKCVFTPVYYDGNPITIPIESLDRLKQEINDLETLVEEEPKSSCLLYNEAPVITLPIPRKVNILQAEYYSKCCYIYATIFNQWLLPYANRIGWRCIRSDKEASTVILPYWSDDDILSYNEFLLNLPEFGTSQSSWSPGYIQLSDGLWYLLPNVILSEINLNYTLDYASEYEILSRNIFDRWKRSNLERVETQIRQGLLPFNKKYPDVLYEDGDKRINVIQVDNMYSVGILPDNYLLSVFPITIDGEKIRKTFTDLWNSGAFLTNYGHFVYENSYENIDENNINYELRDIFKSLIN